LKSSGADGGLFLGLQLGIVLADERLD
jgi:hypothetical protein